MSQIIIFYTKKGQVYRRKDTDSQPTLFCATDLSFKNVGTLT